MSIATYLSTTLGTAAATMSTPPCETVMPGEPDNVNLPMVAYWYTGTSTWGANTLSQTQELSDWHIRIYLPMGPVFVPDTANAEAWIEDFTNAIRGLLYGAVALGGAATGGGMELSDAKAGYAQVGNQMCRVVDMDFAAMLSNVHAIGH